MNTRLVFLLSFLLFTIFIYPQNEKLPVDPLVKTGVLKNGIKYYIQENKKPENRCELRLVVNAGAVQEDNNQRGLAHFVEHMAFNGSKNFKKNELVNYLESVGIKFGPELNAYTSFDETVYMLQVPTDKQDLLEKGFLVLEDWAGGLSFDPAEIDKERGVITEEWRLGRGAQMRMLDKQIPILFKDSKYAERLPIGNIEIIKNFKHDELISFYKDWYRPDLMAVVAVGDFNSAEIEKLIINHFSNIKIPENVRTKEKPVVPFQNTTLFAIASDKEASYNTISVYYKHDPKPFETIEDFRGSIIQSLFSNMINDRFAETAKLPDAPFLYGYNVNTRMVREADVSILATVVKNGGIERGLEALLLEAERVKQFGFTQTELDRNIQSSIRGYEKMFAEKDKTESSSLVNDLVDNFLKNDPILGIENTYKLAVEVLKGIKLEEVNKLAAELIKKENRVVLVNLPEKEGVTIPTEAGLQAVIDKVEKEKITAYEDKVNIKPLVENLPTGGKVTTETKNEKLDFYEWKLSNGVRVIVKKTDFKNDEVIMNSFSLGGTSLVKDEDYMPASTSAMIVGRSGLGEFSDTELKKLLAGKIVSVQPFIGMFNEGFRGSCSSRDIETLMQLVYLNFKPARVDSNAFLTFKNEMVTYLQNSSNTPEQVFSDTVGYVASNYHFRSRPLNMKMLDEMNLAKSIEVFNDRFKDASDFTFVFTGSFEINELKSMVEKYLAVLPSLNRNESWKDINLSYPKGIVERKVEKGIEQKSRISFLFQGEFQWSRKEEYLLESLIDALNIRLREVIREDKGGSYGIGINQRINRIPNPAYTISIGWGCNPERVDELIKDMFSVIDSVKQFGVNNELLVKVKETQRRSRETRLKQNGFWAGILNNYYFYEENPELVLEYNTWIESLTADDIKKMANKYLSEENYIKAVLYPEVKK